MNTKQEYTLEYAIKSSPSILFEYLSTANGLQEWFAPKVDRKDDRFFFSWEESTEEADLLELVEEDYVRFRWNDYEDDEYMEFKITQSGVTNTTILHVTDFAMDYELKEQQLLWDSQIKDLKFRIGG